VEAQIRTGETDRAKAPPVMAEGLV
jgi:hypothetical protein